MSEVKRFNKLLKPEKTALLIIDIQERILPVINNHQLVVDNTLKLIKGFKVLGLPIYLTEQYPKGLGPTTRSILDELGDLKPFDKMSIAAQIEGRNYCSSCESLLKEQANLQRQILKLKERLKPRIDTVDGIPTGCGEDEIDGLEASLSRYREAVEKEVQGHYRLDFDNMRQLATAIYAN